MKTNATDTELRERLAAERETERRLNWERRTQRGQSLPLVIIGMVVLLGFTGMAIDVGFAMLQKRRLQAAVDLGLLSGAKDLPDANLAANTAESWVNSNFHALSAQNITVTTSTSCMIPGCGTHDKMTLSARTETPTFFLKIFGLDNWNVGARGSACGPCESSEVSYDVIVVMDRSYSMCTDSRGRSNGCSDLANAKLGVRELLQFFNPETDRVALAALSSSDTASCSSGSNCPSSDSAGRPYSHAGTGSAYAWQRTTAATAPYCDSTNPADPNSGSNGRFYRSAGDFMDGSAASHDKWVLVSLAEGTNYKNPDGSLNESSAYLDTLDCMQHKYWTPIAPAMYEATEELRLNGRTEDADGNPVIKAIVYFGDGAATAQPMRRNNTTGTPTNTQSWYTPTAGNNGRPCHDAVAQADRARTFDVQVYTIGYALADSPTCTNNNGNAEAGIDAYEAMQDMADDENHYFEKTAAGSVTSIFNEVGHSITSGGVRLVE